MSVIPSPQLVYVRRWAASAPDEMGNATEGYGSPQPWRVRSIDPVSNREPGAQHRDLATIAFTIQADKSEDVPGYRDLVVVDGTEYPVDGSPDDWTRGPWANPAAGVTVWVKRVEG